MHPLSRGDAPWSPWSLLPLEKDEACVLTTVISPNPVPSYFSLSSSSAKGRLTALPARERALVTVSGLNCSNDEVGGPPLANPLESSALYSMDPRPPRYSLFFSTVKGSACAPLSLSLSLPFKVVHGKTEAQSLNTQNSCHFGHRNRFQIGCGPCWFPT